ncbi:hypothetical protein CANCADRAFT_42309 [Tortispora caseinolytica NRRL Y-17796]|uniref:Dipeptidyl peptidase 3 n=1 Tax=Tortispora caseinolytica NRRL Y-17796 TaxID=767744 RepID=A0A1E4TIT6_9ASCO|nr:hypothetical protein CANCADRAFT_42309 [Tortispora caseinolytica NRRL Y-17796]
MASNSHLLADSSAPIVYLDVKQHFDKLTPKQQLYAHHMSRAAHYGTRVVLRQVSPESELIYDAIVSTYNAVEGNLDKLKQTSGVSDEDITAWLEYASQFLSNLGNYKSFGDSKFVPRVSEESFKAIVSVSPNGSELFPKYVSALYATEPQAANILGYPEKGHVTAYYIGDITSEELAKIGSVLNELDIMPENTRVAKQPSGQFQLLVASSKTGPLPSSIPLPEGMGSLEVVYGDHSNEMESIAKSIASARTYAANSTQKDMLDQYEVAFRSGDMQAHKKSQILWIKDTNPSVETDIGFIETYRDPAGVRGEWEGFVAMVNQERTKAFSELVNNAETYIKLLPWPTAFEKDHFEPPDFTSLEILTFAGSGIPAGINIPNYDDVRMNYGFKNVSLGNILSSSPKEDKYPFLRDEDVNLFNEYRGPAFEVQVGIHELLGHGSGKLLSEISPGKFNFDIDSPPVSPLTGKSVTTYYKPGQTWSSVFGGIAGAYEECRAECVAMYLCAEKEILRIFGHTDNADDVLYIAYLLMARAGLQALLFWDPSSKKWGQPHMQARFSILKCFMDSGDDFVKLAYTKEDFSDLRIVLDRSKIVSHGVKAVGEYLQKLHVYKTTADYEGGSNFFLSMSNVGEDMAKFRPIVLANRRPRTQYIQANTVVENDESVKIVDYPTTEWGMIQSFAERNV